MNNIQIEIDENSGYCFGVEYAIQLAEDELDAGNNIYCLGDIVHNDLEVKRLTAKGLKIIDHNKYEELTDCKVLIRAHGEPPETYKTAIKNNIELIDASCPVVLKLQNRVKTAYDRMGNDGQIVIYGKPGHAEVNGLKGQTNGNALIITTEEDLDKIDYSRPVQMFSQTTKSTEGFYRMKQKIQERAMTFNNESTHFNDTICRQVSNREPKLKLFAKEFDIILFVAGRKSSNGKVLYSVCKSINPSSYFITGPDEIKPEWFRDVESAGICGATSTPRWLMEEVVESISQLTTS